MPSCVAIFVHPDDERYQYLINKKAKVPLFNYKVPIIADKRADPEKGTGIVMCCTFGDLTDIEWFNANNLELKISIDKEGNMNNLAKKYSGLPIKEAREQIIQDLKEHKLLTSQKHITHAVNVHERCGTEIEFLVTKQWFIKYLDLKNKFLNLGNKINWYPKHMKVRYDNWINGWQWDWLISRQRYFGVPFPVWYCKKCGEVILADEKDLPVDPLQDKPKKPCKCSSKEFKPEEDIMDTWATSALTPQINMLWKENNSFFKNNFPLSLRPQAHDIITFWLFNTVVKSYFHNNNIPWKDVMISGHGLDPHGKKMSKSKDNIINPISLLEKYPADAIRYWTASSKLGDDFPYQEKDVLTGQKTITKLWNASKFSFMHLKDYKKNKPKKLEAFDEWLLLKLNKIIRISTGSLDNYEYSKTKLEVENFFWNTFADYYLEIIKDRLYNPKKRGKLERLSAQYTLCNSLLTILKLLAPIMPFITEEIYQAFYKEEKSIHLSKWPKEFNLKNKNLEKQGDKVIEIISKVRQFKAQNNKSLKEPVIITIEFSLKTEITPFLEDLKAVTVAKEINFDKEFKVFF
mgnify:CR=1 FL=1